MIYSLVGGGAVAKADPSSVGVNPAWRKALLHVIYGVFWPEGASSSSIAQGRAQLKNYTEVLNQLAPSSGAYFNEVTIYPRQSRSEIH